MHETYPLSFFPLSTGKQDLLITDNKCTYTLKDKSMTLNQMNCKVWTSNASSQTNVHFKLNLCLSSLKSLLSWFTCSVEFRNTPQCWVQLGMRIHSYIVMNQYFCSKVECKMFTDNFSSNIPAPRCNYSLIYEKTIHPNM